MRLNISHILNLLILPVLFLLSACISVDYQGETFPETSSVKIFYSKKFVPKQVYDEIGRATLEAPSGYTSIEIHQKLIEKGKQIGANAVLILSTETVTEGALVNPGGESSPSTPGLSSNDTSADGQKIYANSFGEEKSSSAAPQVEYETDTVLKVIYYKWKTSILKIKEEDKERAEGKAIDNKAVYINQKEQKEFAEQYKANLKNYEAQSKMQGNFTGGVDNEKINKELQIQTDNSDTKKSIKKITKTALETDAKKDEKQLLKDTGKIAKESQNGFDQTSFNKEFDPSSAKSAVKESAKNADEKVEALLDKATTEKVKIKKIKDEINDSAAKASVETNTKELKNVKKSEDNLDKLLKEIDSEKKRMNAPKKSLDADAKADKFVK